MPKSVLDYTGIIDTAANWAMNHITAVNSNYHYEWAGKGPTGWDCSGFVTAAYRATTLDVAWSTTETMIKHFTVDRSDFDAIPYSSAVHLQRGDILMYTNATGAAHGRACGHAAMYLGLVSGYGNAEQQVDAVGSAYGIQIHDFNRSNIWEYVIRYTRDNPGTSAYGYMNETPSIWNSGSRRRTSSDTSSSVSWTQTGTDNWGNPIGYSYTNGYNFTPYLATVAPSVNKIDYGSLLDAKVSGMMFCAGWWYNDYSAGHVHRKEYINPHLEQQIVECQAVGLPYALYAIVRAKNEIEADAECKRLYYVIAKYPPKLGLWLQLDMHNQRAPVNMNELVLDRYYRYITDWGLSSKCGLYMDKSRMYQIDWNKYQYKFYLWLEDHITDQHTLDTINDEVLKSSFFEVE